MGGSAAVGCAKGKAKRAGKDKDKDCKGWGNNSGKKSSRKTWQDDPDYFSYKSEMYVSTQALSMGQAFGQDVRMRTAPTRRPP